MKIKKWENFLLKNDLVSGWNQKDKEKKSNKPIVNKPPDMDPIEIVKNITKPSNLTIFWFFSSQFHIHKK